MNTTELLNEIFLLRYIIFFFVMYCIYLNLRLSKRTRSSDLWKQQFYALMNNYLKQTKTK